MAKQKGMSREAADRIERAKREIEKAYIRRDYGLAKKANSKKILVK